jgi:hypothetical protein
MDGRLEASVTHRHRVPLGLVMLEQGWVNCEQLRGALEAQKAAGKGRLGQWLVRQQGISEQSVTRALGLQWNCPVLALDFHDAEAMAPAMPRFFIDAFRVLPLRVAAGQLVYLGFEDGLDPVASLAIERMSGLRVESGLVRGSLFRAAHQRMLSTAFPKVELIETASAAPIARVLARAIERARPVESRLVRWHDCLWLRMWIGPQSSPLPEIEDVEDVICSMASG